MSQSVRQSNLFAAEDWRRIYRAFLKVNFTSYDFDTIRQSLVEYIRLNYPEDFNDFIDSSEFITIIDMLSWLGQSLAYRVDLNVRENFVDTAERRESIIRLANLLSYSPKRNQASQGFLKVVGVRTTADVIDSNGSNLNNIRINWNDSNNPDWAEQFVLIMNSAFLTSNRFGQPVQQGTDQNNVRTQVYQLNTAVLSNPGIFGFTSNVDGTSVPFENVNISYSDEKGFEERAPNPFDTWHLLYRNDGQGNQSKNTGFFTFFKQGVLQFQDFNIEIPIENRILDINTNNINEDDVWVQNINQDGSVEINWSKIPSVANSNIIYNNIPRRNREIFSVETRPNDQISIRFSDGRFGNVAFGLTRVYHRVSIGQRLTINPNSIQNVSISIPYITQNSLRKTLTLFLSLQETITNGSVAESNDDIAINASQVYYTQNRMVSGEDYNVFPLSNPGILKCKAINRTYSGHNRFIDINDPTGSFQNTNVIGDDGLIYRETANIRQEVLASDNLTPEQILSNTISNIFSNQIFKNFMLDAVLNYAPLCPAFDNLFIPVLPVPEQLMWDRVTGSNTSSTGRFVSSINTLPVSPIVNAINVGLSNPASTALDVILEGSLIKFRDAGWVAIDSVIDNGAGIGNGFTNGFGNIRPKESVEEGDVVQQVLPPIRYTLSTDETESIRLQLEANATFAVFYNISTQRWEIINSPVNGFLENFDYCNNANRWMILFENKSSGGVLWTITARGIKYVFESEEDVRFFFVNRFRSVSKETGQSNTDKITVFKTNSTLEADIGASNIFSSTRQYFIDEIVNFKNTLYQARVTNGPGQFISANWITICPSLGRDIAITPIDNFTYPDGYIEPRRIEVSFRDTDQDGIVDDPTIFNNLIFGNSNPLNITTNNIIFWEKYVSYDGYENLRPIKNVKRFISNSLQNAIIQMNNNFINLSTRSSWSNGDLAVVIDSNSGLGQFYRFRTDVVYQPSDTIPPGVSVGDIKLPGDQIVQDQTEFSFAVGRNNINFLWQHLAPIDQRIDPSRSNIIDLYTLTSEYDFLLRQYLNSDNPNDVMPESPSSTQLAIQYNELEDVRMISDQIIWHPTKYRLLFGIRAEEELRARIKVIKLASATLSDGEIRAQIISRINTYFDINNWDFGDTFYFSEMAAFIHQGLALQIASVVLVPVNDNSRFGNLYEVRSEPDEIFISAATVSDIDIIPVNTETALRVNR